ncbi:hypothetical protein [Streptosporangium sp. NPDC001681]
MNGGGPFSMVCPAIWNPARRPAAERSSGVGVLTGLAIDEAVAGQLG